MSRGIIIFNLRSRIYISLGIFLLIFRRLLLRSCFFVKTTVEATSLLEGVLQL